MILPSLGRTWWPFYGGSKLGHAISADFGFASPDLTIGRPPEALGAAQACLFYVV